jgi:OmcA/MtrC family decaheme c-type cytochrome
VSNFSWDIRSFTINASRQPVITFRIMKDGQAVTQLAAATTVVSGVNGQTVLNPTFQPIPNFVGGPSLYLLMSMPQDGIANPADWNATASVALGNLLIPSGSPKQGSLSNTLSGGYYLADANGYFTATLTGDLVGQPVGGGCTAPVAPATQTSCVASAVSTSPITVPASATLVTAAVLGSFTQINVTGYPYVAADYSVNNVAAPNTTNSNLSTPAGIAPAVGGLTRPGLIALLTAPGYTGRRVAVDSARCNNCHDQLGTSPAYHGQAQWEAGKSGRTIAASPGAVKGAGSTQTGGSQPFVKGTSPRNNAVACSICHLANRVDSAGWSADVSTWFHGIHGASKRTTPFTVTAASATDNYSKLIFPGLAKNCSNCHVPNAVNFGTVSSVGGAPSYTVMTPAGTFTGTKNLLWTTAATGRIPTSNTFATSYYAWAGSRSFDGSTSAQNYGSGFSYSVATGATTAAATTTLVNSPIASACFACHDDNTAAADGHLASIATASGTNYVAGSATSHIITFGGVLYKPRSTAGGATLSNTETCLNCHGAGQAVDAALAHEH